MVVFDNHEYLTEEERRLKEDRNRTKYWKKWGSYVAERQWATGTLLLQKNSKASSRLTRSMQCERTTARTAMPGAVSFAPSGPPATLPLTMLLLRLPARPRPVPRIQMG